MFDQLISSPAVILHERVKERERLTRAPFIYQSFNCMYNKCVICMTINTVNNDIVRGRMIGCLIRHSLLGRLPLVIRAHYNHTLHICWYISFFFLPQSVSWYQLEWRKERFSVKAKTFTLKSREEDASYQVSWQTIMSHRS